MRRLGNQQQWCCAPAALLQHLVDQEALEHGDAHVGGNLEGTRLIDPDKYRNHVAFHHVFDCAFTFLEDVFAAGSPVDLGHAGADVFEVHQANRLREDLIDYDRTAFGLDQSAGHLKLVEILDNVGLAEFEAEITEPVGGRLFQESLNRPPASGPG